MSLFFQGMEKETLRRMGSLGRGLSQYVPPESFDEDDEFEDIEEPNFMPRFQGFPEVFKFS